MSNQTMTAMNSDDETFTKLQEKFKSLTELGSIEWEFFSPDSDLNTTIDSEGNPYASKYKKREILQDILEILSRLLEKTDPDTQERLDFTSLLGGVWFSLGIISIETEELSKGEEQLMKCLQVSEGHEFHPYFILARIAALNQLGLLWSNRDDIPKSKNFLEQSEQLYHSFKQTDQIPIDPNLKNLFETTPVDKTKGCKVLEKLHTLTVYYIAQIYIQLKDIIKSCIYFQKALKLQYYNKCYEPVEWALNNATLSQIFLERNGFKQARHHLAAASYTLNIYETEVKNDTEEDEEHRAAKLEMIRHRSGDVARCWAKYGLLLLNISKDRLIESANDEDVSTLTLDLAELEIEELSQRYNDLPLDNYENQVSDQFLLTFDDAKKVFLNIQSWLNLAKEYYTLEDHASDHVLIVRDLSAAYKALIFFEENEDRQCKMFKRRIDCLEPVVKELNPTYYLLVCRQIWYELAEIYSDMLEIKCDKQRNAVPTAHSLQKINTLAQNSILYFNKFLDSIKEITVDGIEKSISEELVKPVLVAYFHIGRLYGKIVTPDKQAQIFNASKSLEAYQRLVDYCNKEENAAKMMTAELGVCKSMAELLPFKIDKLKRSVTDVSPK